VDIGAAVNGLRQTTRVIVGHHAIVGAAGEVEQETRLTACPPL
jgi:hypothetical protein